jgi:hypothetical protein
VLLSVVICYGVPATPRRLIVTVIGLLSAVPAFALDMPARKPGLWELKMNFEGATCRYRA